MRWRLWSTIERRSNPVPTSSGSTTMVVSIFQIFQRQRLERSIARSLDRKFCRTYGVKSCKRHASIHPSKLLRPWPNWYSKYWMIPYPENHAAMLFEKCVQRGSMEESQFFHRIAISVKISELRLLIREMTTLNDISKFSPPQMSMRSS